MEQRTVIEQRFTIKATAREVYEMLMMEDKHAALTGMAASIEGREGGRFTTCEREASGYSLKLEADRRIIQAWTHTAFPDNIYSIVDIKLYEDEEGCMIMFRQTGAPAICIPWLEDEWKAVYWEPMKEILEGRKDENKA